MRTILLALAFLLTATSLAAAQPGVLTREQLIEYTPDWKGERFADGRPKVSDAILDRMKRVTLEEAWAVVTGAGFSHQFDDSWLSIHPDKVLVGRALTSQWLPGRPDILRVIEAKGREQGRVGGTNAWPVDMLQPRDVYVSDHFGLKQDGASVGDNVGSAIYARTGQRHRLRRRGARHQRPAAARELHVVRALLRSVASHRQRQCRRASQLHHDRHQRADPHRRCVRDAGRRGARPRRRRHLHSAAARGAGGAVVGADATA